MRHVIIVHIMRTFIILDSQYCMITLSLKKINLETREMNVSPSSMLYIYTDF